MSPSGISFLLGIIGCSQAFFIQFPFIEPRVDDMETIFHGPFSARTSKLSDSEMMVIPLTTFENPFPDIRQYLQPFQENTARFIFGLRKGVQEATKALGHFGERVSNTVITTRTGSVTLAELINRNIIHARKAAEHIRHTVHKGLYDGTVARKEFDKNFIKNIRKQLAENSPRAGSNRGLDGTADLVKTMQSFKNRLLNTVVTTRGGSITVGELLKQRLQDIREAISDVQERDDIFKPNSFGNIANVHLNIPVTTINNGGKISIPSIEYATNEDQKNKDLVSISPISVINYTPSEVYQLGEENDQINSIAEETTDSNQASINDLKRIDSRLESEPIRLGNNTLEELIDSLGLDCLEVMLCLSGAKPESMGTFGPWAVEIFESNLTPTLQENYPNLIEAYSIGYNNKNEELCKKTYENCEVTHNVKE